MAAPNDTMPTTFGATVITNPSTAHADDEKTLSSSITRVISDNDADPSTPSRRPLPPYSPFYEHDRPSRETLNEMLGTPTSLSEKELEDGLGRIETCGLGQSHRPLVARDPADPFGTQAVAIDCSGARKEDGMWPSKATLLRGRRAEVEKRRRAAPGGACWAACAAPVAAFWARRDKRQRLAVKLALALLVLGLAVTIGVCINIAVYGSTKD